MSAIAPVSPSPCIAAIAAGSTTSRDKAEFDRIRAAFEWKIETLRDKTALMASASSGAASASTLDSDEPTLILSGALKVASAYPADSLVRVLPVLGEERIVRWYPYVDTLGKKSHYVKWKDMTEEAQRKITEFRKEHSKRHPIDYRPASCIHFPQILPKAFLRVNSEHGEEELLDVTVVKGKGERYPYKLVVGVRQRITFPELTVEGQEAFLKLGLKPLREGPLLSCNMVGLEDKFPIVLKEAYRGSSSSSSARLADVTLILRKSSHGFITLCLRAGGRMVSEKELTETAQEQLRELKRDLPLSAGQKRGRAVPVDFVPSAAKRTRSSEETPVDSDSEVVSSAAGAPKE